MKDALVNFFFDLPLYTPFEILEENKDLFFQICSKRHSREFHGYNPLSRIDSTFRITTDFMMHGDEGGYYSKGGIRNIEVQCKRTEECFIFTVKWDPETKHLTKVGQYPSVADFHTYEVKQYRKVLPKEKLREFTKAIGLAANGVGIGSYVYLRRIFEYLIDNVYKEMLSRDEITEEDYKHSRMDERIKLLESGLPGFLVENKSMYSILSIGIHELDEKTCLEHFDSLRVGIEIILDERLEELRRRDKITEARKRLGAIKERIKPT